MMAWKEHLSELYRQKNHWIGMQEECDAKRDLPLFPNSPSVFGLERQPLFSQAASGKKRENGSSTMCQLWDKRPGAFLFKLFFRLCQNMASWSHAKAKAQKQGVPAEK